MSIPQIFTLRGEISHSHNNDTEKKTRMHQEYIINNFKHNLEYYNKISLFNKVENNI